MYTSDFQSERGADRTSGIFGQHTQKVNLNIKTLNNIYGGLKSEQFRYKG